MKDKIRQWLKQWLLREVYGEFDWQALEIEDALAS
jgi:hypothetical protein